MHTGEEVEKRLGCIRLQRQRRIGECGRFSFSKDEGDLIKAGKISRNFFAFPLQGAFLVLTKVDRVSIARTTVLNLEKSTACHILLQCSCFGNIFQ